MCLDLQRKKTHSSSKWVQLPWTYKIGGGKGEKATMEDYYLTYPRIIHTFIHDIRLMIFRGDVLLFALGLNKTLSPEKAKQRPFIYSIWNLAKLNTKSPVRNMMAALTFILTSLFGSELCICSSDETLSPFNAKAGKNVKDFNGNVTALFDHSSLFKCLN